MNRLRNIITASVLLASISFAFAQNTDKKWLVGIGVQAEDYTSVNNIFDGYFDTDDYSFPSAKLTIARSLAKNFAVDFQFSIGSVENKRLKIKDELFLSTGLGLKWMPLSEKSWFDPYLRVGANYYSYDYTSIHAPGTLSDPTLQYDNDYKESKPLTGKFNGKKDLFNVNGGVGINFWFTKGFGINVESQYNWIANSPRNYSDFFQHSAGLVFRIGGNKKVPDVDTDGDGVPDKDDKCPNVAGPKENNGCPWGDKDGDGVLDKDDKCPDVAGPKENNGCPWPDRDGDGVPDKDDRCPDTPGLAKFKGCPDTDGDGIPDPDDKCPNEAGPKENNGCPVTYKTVTQALQNITFEFNSAKLTADSQDKVKNAASFLNSSSLAGQNAYVDGYTDKSGAAAYNLKLSKQRAQSVVDDLIAAGVDKDRLTARGFGKTNFLCTDADVKAGKYSEDACNQLNRRVEVTPRTLTVQKTVEVKKAPAKKTKK
ncbi:MAG: OmpA family protein [Flavobacteriaceae bacterium]|jgi:outer membrane protein OmpA-like peptidoglycan-associated protein|nr:OmpA family protein [Flavobacteriaceae bacterium]